MKPGTEINQHRVVKSNIGKDHLCLVYVHVCSVKESVPYEKATKQP